jgi:hypothetical protein
LASKLHNDAIEISGTSSPRRYNHERIPFESFVGVGPRRFFDLFSLRLSCGRPLYRKDADGRARKWERGTSYPRVSMQPTSYTQREKLVAARFKEIVGKLGDDSRGFQRIDFKQM